MPEQFDQPCIDRVAQHLHTDLTRDPNNSRRTTWFVSPEGSRVLGRMHMGNEDQTFYWFNLEEAAYRWLSAGNAGYLALACGRIAMLLIPIAQITQWWPNFGRSDVPTLQRNVHVYRVHGNYNLKFPASDDLVDLTPFLVSEPA